LAASIRGGSVRDHIRRPVAYSARLMHDLAFNTFNFKGKSPAPLFHI